MLKNIILKKKKMKWIKKIKNYLIQKAAYEKVKEKELAFEFEVRKITNMLLENKSTKESIELFEEVKSVYFKKQLFKDKKLKEESILLHNHLNRNHQN